MASRTETMSGQVNEDLNQQFAQYVRKQAPHDADSLLTDTGSPEVAAKRRELAWSFVQSQVQPSVDNAYSDAKDGLGQSMDNVSAGAGVRRCYLTMQRIRLPLKVQRQTQVLKGM